MYNLKNSGSKLLKWFFHLSLLTRVVKIICGFNTAAIQTWQQYAVMKLYYWCRNNLDKN
jgi:hypothetical protein